MAVKRPLFLLLSPKYKHSFRSNSLFLSQSQCFSGRFCSFTSSTSSNNNSKSYRLPVREDYEQGQSPSPKIREYFYYIDHMGQLFLDDARMKNFTSCFKDVKFLQFFFRRLRRNRGATGRYEADFPFLSPCGRERNFIRCDDTPLVGTKVHRASDVISTGTAGEEKAGVKSDEFILELNNMGPSFMSIPLTPEHLFVSPQNGRLYLGCTGLFQKEKESDVCPTVLIRSSLASELFAPKFQFNDAENNGHENGPEKESLMIPSHIEWNESIVPLLSPNEQIIPDWSPKGLDKET